jgi:nucleoside recognition membrane protein YjiH
MLRIRKIFGDGSAIRLVIALLCGLLLGFLGGKIGAGMQNVVPFLLFPLLIGIAAALTISARNARPYLMAMCTGLLCWLGITISLLVQSGQAAHTPCPLGNCGTSTVLMSLLVLYLLAGLVIVAVCSLAACAVMRYVRRSREPGRGLPH